MSRIVRKITDANFEHCAKTLLPFAIEFCQSIEDGHVLEGNDLGCIQIVAEVAEALASEKYGKPVFRIRASGKPA